MPTGCAGPRSGPRSGFRRYSVAALLQATGEMAALTDVEIDPDIEGWAFQGLTAVTRPHRGHRLGLLVKAAMLQWLAGRSRKSGIVTFNAVQNEHMVAVNDQLGHRITDYFQSFELDVASAASWRVTRRCLSVLLIEQFDPLPPTRLACCHEIVAACERADDPDLPRHVAGQVHGWWTDGFGGDRGNAGSLPLRTARPSGCYLLMLPDRENLAMATCDLYVEPGARRSGRGSELLAHCAVQARLAGRSRLSAETRDGSPGAAFAAALGAASGISEVLRVLTVDAALAARLPGLRTAAEQRAAGTRWCPGSARRRRSTWPTRPG